MFIKERKKFLRSKFSLHYVWKNTTWFNNLTFRRQRGSDKKKCLCGQTSFQNGEVLKMGLKKRERNAKKYTEQCYLEFSSCVDI